MWTDAYIGDTAHLTNEEHGVYLRLIMFAWRSPDCCLPDDDRRLAIMVGMTDKKWRAIRPVIAAFWTIEDGVWRQKRLTKERDFVRGKSQKNRNAANVKWQAKLLKSGNLGDADAAAGHMPERCQADAPTPTPTPSEEKREAYASTKKKRRPEVDLPEGWVPSDRNMQDAIDRGFTEKETEHEAHQFSNYHRAKQNRYRDWDAAWRTWLGNAAKRRADRGQGFARPASGGSMAEVFMAVGAARSRRAGEGSGGGGGFDGSM